MLLTPSNYVFVLCLPAASFSYVSLLRLPAAPSSYVSLLHLRAASSCYVFLLCLPVMFACTIYFTLYFIFFLLYAGHTQGIRNDRLSRMQDWKLCWCLVPNSPILYPILNLLITESGPSVWKIPVNLIVIFGSDEGNITSPVALIKRINEFMI